MAFAKLRPLARPLQMDWRERAAKVDANRRERVIRSLHAGDCELARTQRAKLEDTVFRATPKALVED